MMNERYMNKSPMYTCTTLYEIATYWSRSKSYNKRKIQEDSYLDPKVDMEPEVELL
jgi:hypothetical protein